MDELLVCWVNAAAEASGAAALEMAPAVCGPRAHVVFKGNATD